MCINTNNLITSDWCIISHIQVVHQTNSNVAPMDNASQQVHNVMDILNALMEVMKSVAVSWYWSFERNFFVDSSYQLFVIYLMNSVMIKYIGVDQFYLIWYVMATLSAFIKVIKWIAVVHVHEKVDSPCASKPFCQLYQNHAFFFYKQIVRQTNWNVQMDNASRQVHNVMDILNALMEVMKSVAVSWYCSYEGKMFVDSSYQLFLVYQMIAFHESCPFI